MLDKCLQADLCSQSMIQHPVYVVPGLLSFTTITFHTNTNFNSDKEDMDTDNITRTESKNPAQCCLNSPLQYLQQLVGIPTRRRKWRHHLVRHGLRSGH